MELSTQGKVALVTGAASGVGAATAARLADAGYTVVLTDIEPVGDIVDGALCLEQDVTDEADWERVIASVLEAHGRLDVLVNNAGVGHAGPVTKTSLEEWRRVMAVNLDAVFLGTKHAVRAMQRGGEGGSIVNVSSATGLMPAPFLSTYCASKGAVSPFTKAVALECAGDSIRVNAVLPGPVRTPIWDKIGVPPAGQAAVAAGAPFG